jgi:1-acyl-sn-glycerol-3-phosphate acyltransferase
MALPTEGAALIVANHTCSSDPTFIQGGCPRVLGFLVAREHFNLHPLTRKLLDYQRSVPIQRNGRDVHGLRQALRRLKEGRAVCLFPEGNLSGVARQRSGVARPGVALLALASGAPVYPVHISGGPCTHHLLASWLWPSRRAVRVVFGPPVDLSAYRNRPRSRQLFEEVTRLLMRKIAELASRERQRPEESVARRSAG